MKTNNNSSQNGKQIIVDVRTEQEWLQDGHSACSVNYPLDQFENKISELMNYDNITLVCRSGARAGVAKAKLLAAGFRSKIENMGSWKNIVCHN